MRRNTVYFSIFVHFLVLGWSVLATLFADVAHLLLMRDVWISTQRACCDKQARYQLGHPTL
jgi:hypothetical protein